MERDELIKILFDPKAYEEEREEAAGYLTNFPDTYTLDALARVAKNAKETNYVKGKAGESIALIMITLGHLEDKYLCDINGIALKEALAVFKDNKPDWYKIICK